MRYTIEDRLFTQMIIDSVTAVSDRQVPESKAGQEVVSDLRFAAAVALEVKKRLEDWLIGVNGKNS